MHKIKIIVDIYAKCGKIENTRKRIRPKVHGKTFCSLEEKADGRQQ